MTDLYEWAAAWGVPTAALNDLRARLGAGDALGAQMMTGLSEAAVSSRVRLEASQRGIKLWRNNVGAMQDETGRVVRFGLANESAAVNKQIKSGDLIGIRPVVITPADLGRTIGQFVSREVKAGDWQYRGTERERAQVAWAALVNLAGGDAQFCTSEGTL